jgi:hypothetical protein
MGEARLEHPDDGMSTVLFVFPFLISTPKTHPTDSTPGTRPLATLLAYLSRIPLAQLDKRIGADGKEYYATRYEIRGVFYSAHTEYSLWYKDQCYGKVDAKYE